MLTIIQAQKASSNLFVHVWYCDLLRGAWTMGLGNTRLICNLLSQHRWWSILHFAFMLTWCFKKRLPVCVNAGYSSLWTLVLIAFCLCTKIVPNLWTFSAPSVCTFYRGWNVTESFSESLHFVIVGLCSWGSWLKIKKPEENFSPRTSQGTTIQ